MIVQTDIKEIINNREIINAFCGKRVLITGASGLIGSMLIRTLEYANREFEANISIIGLARNEERIRKVLGDTSHNVCIIYSQDFDISEACDYIFHTASPTSSKYFIEHPVETIDTMISSTKAMLELAKINNAIMVYVSSMEEYGVPFVPNETMTEDKVGIIDHLSARSSYPVSKRMCECMCSAYALEYSVSSRIARLAQTFGAGIPLTDGRVSMQFAKSAKEKRDIVLHTEGHSISNYCYLSDTLSGLLLIAVNGIDGEAYNVCNDKESRSIYEIAKLVSDTITDGEISVIKRISKDIDWGYAPNNTMRLSSKKLKALGWEPKVDMAEGYRRLVQYLYDAEKV